MERLRIERTDKTPEVDFDPGTGNFRFIGWSIHENSAAFFRPLLECVEAYVKQPQPRTLITISLEYFNSSSSKYILDMLRMWDDLQAGGQSSVELAWHYAEDDLDMQEAGRDYAALLDMPVRLVSDPLY